jgi:hypothetical protein
MLLVGCRRAAPPPDPPEVGDGADARPRALFAGPGLWSDPALAPIRAAVPAGWGVWSDDREGVLVVFRARPGVAVLVVSPRSDAPRALPDCAWVSIDRVGQHRDVPAIAPASLATCAPIEPEDDAVFAWLGRVDGRPLHVEVHLAPGELVQGRDDAAAILGGIEALSDGGAAARP